ncbi:hypothetical protein [Bacillus badius]|uniref:hypothetical protein n=1 Tax=Bacillus badius TaxID=1455 RepID=UPI0007B36EF5|nr:hypothetical protein [Bacillus badius]KZR56946.1 hypothetical protein A3781_20410 [Bacillus badius]
MRYLLKDGDAKVNIQTVSNYRGKQFEKISEIAKTHLLIVGHENNKEEIQSLIDVLEKEIERQGRKGLIIRNKEEISTTKRFMNIIQKANEQDAVFVGYIGDFPYIDSFLHANGVFHLAKI